MRKANLIRGEIIMFKSHPNEFIKLVESMSKKAREHTPMLVECQKRLTIYQQSILKLKRNEKRLISDLQEFINYGYQIISEFLIFLRCSGISQTFEHIPKIIDIYKQNIIFLIDFLDKEATHQEILQILKTAQGLCFNCSKNRLDNFRAEVRKMTTFGVKTLGSTILQRKKQQHNERNQFSQKEQYKKLGIDEFFEQNYVNYMKEINSLLERRKIYQQKRPSKTCDAFISTSQQLQYIAEEFDQIIIAQAKRLKKIIELKVFPPQDLSNSVLNQLQSTFRGLINRINKQFFLKASSIYSLRALEDYKLSLVSSQTSSQLKSSQIDEFQQSIVSLKIDLKVFERRVMECQSNILTLSEELDEKNQKLASCQKQLEQKEQQLLNYKLIVEDQRNLHQELTLNQNQQFTRQLSLHVQENQVLRTRLNLLQKDNIELLALKKMHIETIKLQESNSQNQFRSQDDIKKLLQNYGGSKTFSHKQVQTYRIFEFYQDEQKVQKFNRYINRLKEGPAQTVNFILPEDVTSNCIINSKRVNNIPLPNKLSPANQNPDGRILISSINLQKREQRKERKGTTVRSLKGSQSIRSSSILKVQIQGENSRQDSFKSRQSIRGKSDHILSYKIIDENIRLSPKHFTHQQPQPVPFLQISVKKKDSKGSPLRNNALMSRTVKLKKSTLVRNDRRLSINDLFLFRGISEAFKFQKSINTLSFKRRRSHNKKVVENLWSNIKSIKATNPLQYKQLKAFFHFPYHSSTHSVPLQDLAPQLSQEYLQHWVGGFQQLHQVCGQKCGHFEQLLDKLGLSVQC